MKVLKKIIIWLVALIAILVVVAYLLPGSYYIERSVVIKAGNRAIFDMACKFDNFDLWTPWSIEDDSTAVVENIGGCEVGALQRWKTEDMGSGEMKIVEMVPLKMIKWEIGFENSSQKMISEMIFSKKGDGFLVTWSAEGELGFNPIFRYYGLMLDSDIGGDFEKGLAKMKELCESLPDYPGIGITLLESRPAISVKDSVTYQEIGPFMETFMPALYMYMIRQGGKIAGHPYSIYHNWDTAGLICVEAGIPLEEMLEGEDPIKPAMTPGGKAVRAIYYGPYEEMAVVYEALEKYIEVMKLEPVGIAYEVYVTDPNQEPDPAKWETHVFFPLR